MDSKKNIIDEINPKRNDSHEWYLSLLDDEKQLEYEKNHLSAVMKMLKFAVVKKYLDAIKEAENEIKKIENSDERSTAENYRKIGCLKESIEAEWQKIDVYKPVFDEPYFARMDLVDNMEGYNSYYIGRQGNIKLEIIDWRAPLAKRYYQKSRVEFDINEYHYKTVLRRALKTKDGKLEDFKNEFLSVRDYLSNEEIAGRDEEILFDPYLREVLKSRKEDTKIRDIIRTIQEQQYEIITCPESSNFVLQGCAGSGKTMVMLHRLSYLMYNNDDIKSHDVLMLTPSKSFNSFIEELQKVLELQSVRTMTAQEYYIELLKSEKVDIEGKIDWTNRESEEYLSYLYSPSFTKDVRKQIRKTYENLYGIFTGDECKTFISSILENLKKLLAVYDVIKNASYKIRRALLGEIKEKREGGLYYTKPLRYLMNAYLDVKEFLEVVCTSEKSKNAGYFFKELSSFYESCEFIRKKSGNVIKETVSSLNELTSVLKKEIVDLKRYKVKQGEKELYTYYDRILAKEEIVKEAEKLLEKVNKLSDYAYPLTEFMKYLSADTSYREIGKSGEFISLLRYFYKATVKKKKVQYGMTAKSLYPSDCYALARIASETGKNLAPKYSFVFVDEGQDISLEEYDLIRSVNRNAKWNVFGDLNQNITSYRGVDSWENAFSGFVRYDLNKNYRNTNQIVEYVSKMFDAKMEPTGFDGPPVKTVSKNKLGAFFKNKKGLKAVIVSEKNKENYLKKSYNVLSEKGKLSKSKINLLTVWESKGLEFGQVAVDNDGLGDSEKYIAYTRALYELGIIES